MTTRDDLLPESPVEGLVPTMNNTGWMTETLDEVSRGFAAFAGQIDDEVLDIGCAYGIATLAALERGARVLACDMEPGHLEVLLRRVPEAARDRFRVTPGVLPGVDFEPESFGAILASRVLHFLDGAGVEESIRKTHDWLKPGGRLFLVVDSPYTGPWRTKAADYERRKAAGEAWPGYIDNYAQFLPPGTDPDKHPRYIHPMDPDIITRVCEHAGFKVLEARFLGGGGKHSTDRDHAGLIAEKPAAR